MNDEDTADAFALLGSDVRLDVIRALAEAERLHDDSEGSYDVGFSALYDAVEVDSSSAFAYHLDELEDIFVEHTEDGYRLTDRGQRVVRAILAGTYTEQVDFGPVTLDGYCPICEATSLDANHADDRLAISCPDCGTQLVSEELTASQVADRTEEAVLSSVAVRVRADLEQAVDGVCGACGGRVEQSIEPVPVPNGRTGDVGGRGVDEESAEQRYMFRGDCRSCHRRVNAPIECCLFSHPAVAGFYWEHGVLLRDEPIWVELQRLDGDEWTVQPTNAALEPPAGDAATAFDCRVELAGDELHLEVDADLTVRSARSVYSRRPDQPCRNRD